MAGKRPDQYNISEDEGRVTDYKTHPNEPEDLKADRHRPKQSRRSRRKDELEEIDKRILKGDR